METHPPSTQMFPLSAHEQVATQQQYFLSNPSLAGYGLRGLCLLISEQNQNGTCHISSSSMAFCSPIITWMFLRFLGAYKIDHLLNIAESTHPSLDSEKLISDACEQPEKRAIFTGLVHLC